MMKEQFIEVSGAPAIDGLWFRSYQGESDFPVMLNLINRCKVVDQVQRSVTMEDLKRKLKHRDNFDIHKDMLFAEVGNEPVAYGQLRWHKEMDGPIIHVIHALVDPEWRRKGIGTAMLRFFEARHRQIAEEHSHAADAAKAFEVTLSDTQLDLLALLEKEGYSTERYFIEMVRPCSAVIPEAPMPDGLEVRPVEEAHLGPIYAAMDEAFEDHWGHIPITEKMIASWMNNPDTDPKLWQVAWDENEVAGMVLNFIDKKENAEYQRQRGYTEDISVRRPWRKRGLAKALLARSILMFKEMGMQETSLSVDVQNPNGALGLYEGMGYKQIKQYIMYRKPMDQRNTCMPQKHPLPEGLTARPAQIEDAQQVVDLLNAFSMHTKGIVDETLEIVNSDWTSPNFLVKEDTRVVLDEEGRIIAYVAIFAWNAVPVNPFIYGCVHPDYENQRIGRYLMEWGEKRAYKVFDEVPSNARVTLQTHTVNTYDATKRLYERFGMTLFRHSFQMRVNLDNPPEDAIWPEGITLRAYQHPQDLEAVYLADKEVYRDHFGYVEESFEEGFKNFKHHMVDGPYFDAGMWFLAMDGDDIAGFALCRKHSWEDTDMGWVSSLGVLRPWRRRGLATALLLHAFKANYERGFRKVGLGVDAGNLTGALKLYENAGMYVHRQMDRYHKVLREGVELSVTELQE